MKVAIAQIDPIVGDFKLNFEKIKAAYLLAESNGADLCLAPELSISGYPPHDLMDRPEIYSRTDEILEKLKVLTQGKSCALAVGHVSRNPSPVGRHAQNTASLIQAGDIVFSQSKTLLPTYDVFDEARYFEPAREVRAFDFVCRRSKDSKGLPEKKKICIAICEDLWGEDSVLGRKLYGVDPQIEYAKLKPELLISLSASPYQFDKRAHRESLHQAIAIKLKCPVIYVNQTGATDDILFDGASFVCNSIGELKARFKIFSKHFGIFDLEAQTTQNLSTEFLSEKSSVEDKKKSLEKIEDKSLNYPILKWQKDSALEMQPPSEIHVLLRALETGTQEYFKRCGFKLAIIGLSGGIDSALVAAIATKALGASHLLGIAMPSQYSSTHSITDAEDLAVKLGIHFQVLPIKFMFSTMKKEIAQTLATQETGSAELKSIAEENLQARLRGMSLMTLSNHYNALVLTTGNKSELATGYCTLYGDMCGALDPIGDVLKTRVYDLAREFNRYYGAEIINQSTLTKAPSAELKPGQKDQDSLPPYEQLDPMLVDYLEEFVPVTTLEAKYGPWVHEILRKMEINEYKRRQAAVVLKISSKAFGVGRRVPIAKKWDQ